jgi:hypothetical protein
MVVVFIRKICIQMVFVYFAFWGLYKLGKNWQARAWDPDFKTAGSATDAAMILGLFLQKNLKINIDRKLY